MRKGLITLMALVLLLCLKGCIVVDPNGLTVSIEAAPTEGFAPVAVQFAAVVTDGNPPYSYFWDFDDGSSSTLQNPTHVFGTPGEFLVNLMVTDAQGDEAMDLVPIGVL